MSIHVSSGEVILVRDAPLCALCSQEVALLYSGLRDRCSARREFGPL